MKTYCPPIATHTLESREIEPTDIQETFPVVDAVAIVTEQVTQAVQAINEPLAAVEAVVTRKPRTKQQLASVGAAAIDYNAITVPQLRKRCSLQGINWRTGGDYGKAMRKNQMI